MQHIENALRNIYKEWAGASPEVLLPLAPSGSDRVYYRIKNKQHSVIGTYNTNRKENIAFIEFSKHFYEKGLPVPKIIATDLEQQVYLQEDLGTTTLYSYLLERPKNSFPDYLVKLYEQVVEQLAHLQIRGAEGLDFDKCYPTPVFDKQSMLWDLNYFKYYFLKLAYIPFDEADLEKDFQAFTGYLLQADNDFFMFRDFQTRNIMIRNSQPVFIDYQGGRRGPLQYDLVSLLFQAKAAIPHDIRHQLVQHYLKTAQQLTPIRDTSRFMDFYYAFALMRCIQVLGAYGFRGLYERKNHFLSSIPYALDNLKWLLQEQPLKVTLPTLTKCLNDLLDAPQFKPFDTNVGEKSLLTVRVTSFSYKKNGIPKDDSGNGGGFVFDCRFIHNPGRYEPYKKLTGRDEPVINFLQQHSNIKEFLNDAFRIVDKAVENYIERSFTNLTVNFGCTGGQHRSVYSADMMAKHLKDKYGVNIVLKHIEQEKKHWIND